MIKRLAWTVLTVVLFTSLAARAENWPQFRGPTGQGISTEKDLPTEWSATKNVAWKTEITGEGWSSPIVWENRVFLTAARDKGTSSHVIALDRESGNILWDVEVLQEKPSKKEGRNSYATPTPVTDGKRVYAFFGSGGGVAVDYDGKVAWRYTDEQFYSQHGLGSSPILYSGLLIMPWDHSIKSGPEMRIGWQIPWEKSYVLALDANTGKERYRAMRGSSRIGHMTPQVADVDGKPQLISAAGDVINAFDPMTGEKIWWVETGGEGVVPSPVVGNGKVYSSSGFPTAAAGKTYKPTLAAFKLGGSGDVTKSNLVWEQHKAVPMIPSMLLVDKLLYTITEDGTLRCLDEATGDEIFQEKLKGNFYPSPVHADGRIYLLGIDGVTTVIEAGREFKKVATNELGGEKCQASPSISAGNLFIRTEKRLYCIRK